MQNLEASLQEIQELLKAGQEWRYSALPSACVLCHLVDRSVLAYLDFLFAEFVNDIELRLQFRHARGFCRLHTQAVRAKGDALGIAILYSDLADMTLNRWREQPPTRTSRLPFTRPKVSSPERPCPACSIEEEANRRYVLALVQGLEQSSVQEAMREAMKSEPCLCVAHFEEIIRTAKGDVAITVQQIAAEGLERLHTELSEFIRKNDYRFRGEAWGAERDSWKRALSQLMRPPQK